MPVWSAPPVLVGRVWRLLVVVCFLVVLQWLETEARKGCAAGISFNKALVRGGSLDRCGGIGCRHLLRWRGPDWKTKHVDATADVSRSMRGRSLLQLGDLHTVALGRRRDL
jgi:hypothetical protein